MRWLVAIDPALARFAERLRQEIAAERVLLFGSHARGEAHAQSDYDLLVVSPKFATVEPARRAIGLRQLWPAPAIGPASPLPHRAEWVIDTPPSDHYTDVSST